MLLHLVFLSKQTLILIQQEQEGLTSTLLINTHSICRSRTSLASRLLMVHPNRNSAVRSTMSLVRLSMTNTKLHSRISAEPTASPWQLFKTRFISSVKAPCRFLRLLLVTHTLRVLSRLLLQHSLPVSVLTMFGSSMILVVAVWHSSFLASTRPPEPFRFPTLQVRKLLLVISSRRQSIR